jgi:hypothetical protein
MVSSKLQGSRYKCDTGRRIGEVSHHKTLSLSHTHTHTHTHTHKPYTRSHILHMHIDIHITCTLYYTQYTSYTYHTYGTCTHATHPRTTCKHPNTHITHTRHTPYIQLSPLTIIKDVAVPLRAHNCHCQGLVVLS